VSARRVPWGDVDYRDVAERYARYRIPDERIARMVHGALGDARRVLNVGAGAGGYEPRDREVVAVEPSAEMRAQRPAGLPPAVDAVAEALPFADGEFEAAMATFTVHQWPDLEDGLRELRRVTRGPIAILTGDRSVIEDFWLAEYVPELLAEEARRYPGLDEIAAGLGGSTTVSTVPIPLDCTDRFTQAYYGRPEGLLDPDARLCNSSWSFVSAEAVERFTMSLARDLESGAWDERHGALRTQPFYEGPLALVVSA
jgi:SAM-dependent methyltransferase